MTRRRRRAVAAVSALVAFGFLGAMAGSGGRREGQHRVRFQAAGLMPATPDLVERVEVEATGRRLVLVRVAPAQWVVEGEARRLPAVAVAHLETSLRFMHVAEPVRVMTRPEWEGAQLDEFGLDPPRYAVSLSGAGRTLVAARFGAMNPQQVLQYARVEGRDELYLLPRFVGREWEQLIEGMAGQ